jgi:hypothetical protein
VVGLVLGSGVALVLVAETGAAAGDAVDERIDEVLKMLWALASPRK